MATSFAAGEPASPSPTTEHSPSFAEPMPAPSTAASGPAQHLMAASGPPGPLTAAFSDPSSLTLRVRQHPVRARACGSGNKDRRTVDPPPVIEVIDPSAAGAHEGGVAINPFLIMHASLWTSDMERSVLLFEGEQVLVGSLTSVMSVLRDEFGKQGVFFIFPDLSVRCDGIFRLRFSLMNLQGSAPNQLAQAGGPVIATIFTEPFEVFKPKLFPGVAEPTMLIKSFTLQGHPLPIRKFRRKRSSIAGGVETIITVPNTSTASARLPTSAPTSASISVSGTNTPSMAFAQLPMNPASSSFTPDGGGGDGSGGGGSRGTARTRGDGSASGPGSHAVAYSDSDTSFVLGSSALHEGEYEDYD